MEFDHVSVREARARFAALLDAAEQGSVTLITRHGQAAAAIVPAALLDQLTQPRPAIEAAAGALRGALRTLEPLLGGQPGPPQPTVTWTRHQSRPGRAVLVAVSLDSLRGPAEGTVELPLWLFWSAPDRTFDLSRPSMVRSMYETVLGEATRPDDLTGWLDRDTLIRVWPSLYLPRGVRQAWEERHPALRAAPGRAA